ncbi:hypothetical protein NFI96_001578 [Prochilodus magdalenae]|nr:hypothetical protein NFI96_001578 [Prochilodus magdalenae]
MERAGIVNEDSPANIIGIIAVTSRPQLGRHNARGESKRSTVTRFSPPPSMVTDGASTCGALSFIIARDAWACYTVHLFIDTHRALRRAPRTVLYAPASRPSSPAAPLLLGAPSARPRARENSRFYPAGGTTPPRAQPRNLPRVTAAARTSRTSTHAAVNRRGLGFDRCGAHAARLSPPKRSRAAETTGCLPALLVATRSSVTEPRAGGRRPQAPASRIRAARWHSEPAGLN